jgi:hypothetical protein
MAKLDNLSGKGKFAIHPYKCSAGNWHLGRNKETARMIEDFMKQGKQGKRG